VLVGINLAIGFVVPGIAWQAHLGGIVVGGAIAFLFSKTRHRSKHALQTAALVAIGLIVVVVLLARSAQLAGLF